MDLVPSLEQRDLVATVEAFAERELSAAHAHERAREWGSPAVPVSEATWSRLADLGVLALGLPEEAGGLDLPVVEEALVFRVLGRHLAPLGLLGSLLAARFANAAGDKELRNGLSEGAVRAGLALREEGGRVVVADLPGGGAVVRWTEQGPGLCVGTPAGTPLDSLDPTTILTGLPAAEIGPPIPVAAAEAAMIGATGSLLAAAMLVGNAEACRDLAVSYAKERVQFDKPIGVYQAIKHPCADMATRCEAASSQLLFAALALRDGRSDAAFHVAAAKRVAGRTALANAHATVQIFGGMGFTWEHDAHLHVSRAQLLDRFAGTPREQRDALLGTAPQIP
jgi:alkylation response protein AidB-like acyl-CoA dehydrogenase